jgi:hypothetical protein
MPDQVMHLKASAPAKLMMLAVVSLAFLASWFVCRWYMGNTIAEHFVLEENRLETAQRAASWAPKDPLPYWRLGSLIEKELPPDQIAQSVAAYEKAVALAPNDYRFWMSLGQALEQAGEPDKAEKALREAVRLAPAYAYPRWHLGNLLIRLERYDEAFKELRQASDANGEFQSQLFNLAWQVNKDDFGALQKSIGDTPDARALFSRYLLDRRRFDEGLRLWNTLSETEKRSRRFAADPMIAALLANKRFHQAVEVWNEVAPGPQYRAAVDRLIDRGFEDNVAHGPDAVFGWQVQSLSQVQIGIDAGEGHQGQRCLRLFFQVRSNLEGINVSQLVPVQPNKEYDFECYVKTERLQSGSTPYVSIVDATDDGLLVNSGTARDGNNNWQRIALSFKTGAKTEAVRIKILRNSCADNAVCPIFGTAWYDDFDLKPRK